MTTNTEYKECLGPANDQGAEVQMEIRAAEIALMYDQERNPPKGSPTMAEQKGFFDPIHDPPSYYGVQSKKQWNSGWLAHQIVFHEAELLHAYAMETLLASGNAPGEEPPLKPDASTLPVAASDDESPLAPTVLGPSAFLEEDAPSSTESDPAMDTAPCSSTECAPVEHASEAWFAALDAVEREGVRVPGV